MKKVAFILVLTYLMYLIQPIFILIDFKVNQNYISKELCENRETPELECNGKCYLMKKLEKAVGKVQKIENNKELPVKNSDNYSAFDFLSKHIAESNCHLFAFAKTSEKVVVSLPSYYEIQLGIDTPPPQYLV